jgi:hypothetical protein
MFFISCASFGGSAIKKERSLELKQLLALAKAEGLENYTIASAEVVANAQEPVLEALEEKIIALHLELQNLELKNMENNLKIAEESLENDRKKLTELKSMSNKQ